MRPLWTSLGIIGVFFIIEVVGAILTDSLALLADAGHMLSDVAALALALFAIWIAQRPATRERTYGCHRVEVLAAGANATTLLAAGANATTLLAAGANATTLLAVSLYIFWEAYQRMSQPPEVASGPMLVVAFAGLISNIAAAFVLHGGAQESINMRGAFLHVLTDMLGSVGAIIAGAVMYFTGWYYADPLVSVVIGLLVLFSGGRLLRDTVEILMEATPRHIDLAEVERAFLSLPGVVGIHDLHVWTVTSGFLAMSGHLKLLEPDGGRTLGPLTTAAGAFRHRTLDHPVSRGQGSWWASTGPATAILSGVAALGPPCKLTNLDRVLTWSAPILHISLPFFPHNKREGHPSLEVIEMMGYGGWGIMGGFGGLGMLLGLVFWIGVVLLVVWGAERLLSGRQQPVHDTAMDILHRRYASGEISAAEYQVAKRDLAQ